MNKIGLNVSTLKALAIAPLLATLYPVPLLFTDAEAGIADHVSMFFMFELAFLGAAYACTALVALPTYVALKKSHIPWVLLAVLIAALVGLISWSLDVTFGGPYLSEHELIYPGPLSGVLGFAVIFPIALFFAYLARDR